MSGDQADRSDMPAGYLFGPDNPTGVWQQAIDYLNRAEVLMQQMAVETPASRFTLADVHGATFAAARASVGGHYRHEWMSQAAPPGWRVVARPPVLGTNQPKEARREQ